MTWLTWAGLSGFQIAGIMFFVISCAGAFIGAILGVSIAFKVYFMKEK